MGLTDVFRWRNLPLPQANSEFRQMLNHYKLLAIAIFLLGADVTSATSLRFLKNAAPIVGFTEEDFRILKENVDNALENTPDGEKLAWKNANTGHAGLLNPIDTYEKDGEWKIADGKK